MFRNALVPAAAAAAALIIAVALAGVARAAETKDSGVKKIEIKDKKYSPAKVTIRVGQTVLWTNRDDGDHTIVAEDGSFGTGDDDDLSRGESYKFTFKKKGKYKYHCKYHPREKGEIVVE